MTPKDKAIELINNFSIIGAKLLGYQYYCNNGERLHEDVVYYAKSCAKIACDEMLSFQELMFGQDKDSTLFILATKDEIESY